KAERLSDRLTLEAQILDDARTDNRDARLPLLLDARKETAAIHIDVADVLEDRVRAYDRRVGDFLALLEASAPLDRTRVVLDLARESLLRLAVGGRQLGPSGLLPFLARRAVRDEEERVRAEPLDLVDGDPRDPLKDPLHPHGDGDADDDTDDGQERPHLVGPD